MQLGQYGDRGQWEETKLEGEPPEIRVVDIEAGYCMYFFKKVTI